LLFHYVQCEFLILLYGFEKFVGFRKLILIFDVYGRAIIIGCDNGSVC
jgi:hypothetical protein